MEVEVIKPMLHEGKRVAPGEGGDNPVINLPDADAVYLETIGRVRRITPAGQAVAEIDAELDASADAEK